MKLLLINKFLHPNGGSETYLFQLGRVMEQHGHEVQYFGMDHEGRCVGNGVEAYTTDMDFHGGGRLKKLFYPIKTIYSVEARRKLRLVLEDFAPDVCHLNNFNYQLTPSIILEIRRWQRQTGHPVKIVFTAHDYQLVCPNHMLRSPVRGVNCQRCLHGDFVHCIKGRCIHGSLAKSVIGAAEAIFWKWKRVYGELDVIICPTQFMKSKLDCNPILAEKTMVLLNFIDADPEQSGAKQDYVLYFGRFSEEKGIRTLLAACRQLPQIRFIFAGTGPLEEEINAVENIQNVGFQRGQALQALIREARFSVYPSAWYGNCPLSVMESQRYGTPVLGANIGGIPELIEDGRTGMLFESGNVEELKTKLLQLWADPALVDAYSKNCAENRFDTSERYYHKLIQTYM